MKKITILFSFLLLIGCQNYGQLKHIANVPNILNEVSGIETVKGSDLLWMHNDGGNLNQIYRVSTKGKIIEELYINAKNNDWEDITSDPLGNLYLADFGNNANARQNLVILKIKHQDLFGGENVEVERIHFSYPNQTKFPPKKKQRFFDAEALFYANDSLYIFTKSRVKYQYGITSLYKIPAKKGNYEAEFIAKFETCNDLHCWITAADISPNGKKVVLLNHNTVLLFTDFTGDNFFNGKLTELPLNYISQKEGVTFKDNNTLYITDEKAHGKGGKLYTFSLN